MGEEYRRSQYTPVCLLFWCSWCSPYAQVTIVRADQQPLGIPDLETLFVFCQNLLGVFSFPQSRGGVHSRCISAIWTSIPRSVRCCAGRRGRDDLGLHRQPRPVEPDSARGGDNHSDDEPRPRASVARHRAYGKASYHPSSQRRHLAQRTDRRRTYV